MYRPADAGPRRRSGYRNPSCWSGFQSLTRKWLPCPASRQVTLRRRRDGGSPRVRPWHWVTANRSSAGLPSRPVSCSWTPPWRCDIPVNSEILHEKGPAAGVLHVRLSDVLSRTGLTTGAAYRLWDNQQDFHDAVAVAAMRWRDRSMLARTTTAAFAVVAAGGGLEDLLKAAGAANVQQLPADNGIITTLALRAAAYNQPALLRAGAERSQDMVASFQQVYLELLDTYRLRMREPFTLDHLADGMSALVDGFGAQTACGTPSVGRAGRRDLDAARCVPDRAGAAHEANRTQRRAPQLPLHITPGKVPPRR